MLFYAVPVLLGVILIIIKYSLWREKYLQNLPGVKPGFFNIPGDLTGMCMGMISKDGYSVLEGFKRYLKERTEQFQQHQLFCLWFCYQPHIFIFKAEAVKQLLSKEIGQNKSWHYENSQPFVGTGLITSSTEIWKPRRKLLTPCFHTNILREFLTVFNERSQKLVQHLQKETEEEFTYIGSTVTLTALDIIYETIIGTTVKALENKKSLYINTVKRLLDIYMSKILKFWEWSEFIYNLTSGREAKRHQKFVHEFIQSVIEEKKKKYLTGHTDDGKRKRKALMDLLLELHFETQQLSEQDIHDEINTFVAAGYETVSLTMTWVLYLIGLYPDIQDKIHEELDKVFGSDMDRYATESDLNDLKYLHCVLKETQRLYSTVPMIAREVTEDANIGGYTIPKGTSCVVLIYFLHKEKEVFPDPEKFDPDRFLPENSVNIPEYGFIPFSAGARNCIGQRYAIMEMKTIISSILRNYTIESLDSRDKVQSIMQITLHPSIPIRIRIRHRKNIK